MKKRKKEAKRKMGRNKAARKRNRRPMSKDTKRILKDAPGAAHVGNRFAVKPLRKTGRFQVFFDGRYVAIAALRSDGTYDVRPTRKVLRDEALLQAVTDEAPRIQQLCPVLVALQAA